MLFGAINAKNYVYQCPSITDRNFIMNELQKIFGRNVDASKRHLEMASRHTCLALGALPALPRFPVPPLSPNKRPAVVIRVARFFFI
jgi:hypothetical protein